MSFFATITTIQSPTDCMRCLTQRLATEGGKLIVAGDTKGPNDYRLEATEFLSIHAQLELGFSIAKLLPTKHYSRKNLAYLYAMRSGATLIYETDDDNKPLDSWACRAEHLGGVHVSETGSRWANVYRYFTEEMIWPRGLPLDKIHEVPPQLTQAVHGKSYPIQQGLVNLSPDVDAVWRLVLDRKFTFDPKQTNSVMISPGTWCPFNTQSTWWWTDAFPLLYIPSYCSFRMCDIWKSFVAQRCLWEIGVGVVFHPPEVVQERNEHDLTRDFEHEVPGYLANEKIVSTLEKCSLKKGRRSIPSNLATCYRALVDEGVFPQEELALVDSWLSDVSVFIKK